MNVRIDVKKYSINGFLTKLIEHTRHIYLVNTLNRNLQAN